MPYENRFEVLISAGYHDNSSSYNKWAGTQYHSKPGFFTPFQTKTEILVATGDIFLKPLLNLASTSLMIASAAIMLLDGSKFTISKRQSLADRVSCIPILFVNVAVIGVICSVILITRMLSTLVDDVNRISNLAAIEYEIASSDDNDELNGSSEITIR